MVEDEKRLSQRLNHRKDSLSFLSLRIVCLAKLLSSSEIRLQSSDPKARGSVFTTDRRVCASTVSTPILFDGLSFLALRIVGLSKYVISSEIRLSDLKGPWLDFYD